MTAATTVVRRRRFTPGRIIVFLLVIALLVFLDGNEKIPSGAASGTTLNGSSSTPPPGGDELRVATFNIDSGVGPDDNRLDLDRTAETMRRGYDLIGLEEVHGGLPFTSDDQSLILGQKLGLQSLFAPVERRWWRDAFGDGILTDLPPIHWQRIPLANGVSRSNRELLLAQLQFDGRPLNVLVTHLDNFTDRAAELGTVISLFQSLQPPVIILADLNTTRDDPQLQALEKIPSVADPIAKICSASNVDWILARGMYSLGAGFIDNHASDHQLAWAALKLDSAAAPPR
jgi:endonuclease/exonuclease/phosphatase family metal-dependent hydrolase